MARTSGACPSRMASGGQKVRPLDFLDEDVRGKLVMELDSR